MGSCANGGGYYHYSYAVVRGCDRSISILHRRYHCCVKWTIIHPKLSPELSLLTSMCPAAPLQLKHSCMASFRYISPPLALSPLIWSACVVTCTNFHSFSFKRKWRGCRVLKPGTEPKFWKTSALPWRLQFRIPLENREHLQTLTCVWTFITSIVYECQSASMMLL